MRSGGIKLYQQSTCQQIATLVHGEPVDTIKFDNTPHYLVSASCKTLKMWTIKGQLLWTVKNVRNLSTVSFTEDGKCLVTADRYGNISILNTCNGTNAQPQDPENSSRNLNTNLSQDARWKVISVADICPRTELIAVSYRVGPPEIWSIEQDAMIGTCNLSRDKPGIVHITPVSQLLFNPNPASELLAVTYQDGELAIFNRWSCGFEIKAISAYPQILAATMDGRTLASASSSGIIKLWDFETLTLLSWIRASEHDIRSMAFSDDGSRLYDLRDNGTKTRVWELAGLAKKGVPEESTLDEPINSQAPVTIEEPEPGWGPVYITEILAPPGAGCILAGKSDGSVVVYDSATGGLISSLYTHGPVSWAFVESVSWTRDMIASADALNNIIVRTLEKAEPNGWKVTAKVFEKKLKFDRDGNIRKLLFHPSSPLLLVLTGKGSLMLFNISTQDRIPLSGQSSGYYGSCLWLPTAQGSALLLGKRAMAPVIDIFAPKANDFEYHLRAAWDLGTTEIPLASVIKSISTDAAGNYLAVISSYNPKVPPVYGLLVYKIPLLDSLDGLAQDHTEIASEVPILTIPGTSMNSFFGFHGKRLVFLDHELWVKSIDLSKVKAGSTSTLDSLTDQHFFIPRELFGSNHGVARQSVDGVVTDTGNVVFPKEGELVVVRHALEWTFRGE